MNHSKSANPYASLPGSQFWRSAVAEPALGDIMPVMAKRFTVTADTRIATAGSCFAQNLALRLQTSPVCKFLTTETPVAGEPLFSARTGNIYTPRQLVQLLSEASAGVPLQGAALQRGDGRFIDAYRPSIFPEGLADEAAVMAARPPHLAAVREAAASCDVFVFTLGLTEAWLSRDGARVFTVCPATLSDQAEPTVFTNFGFDEILADLTQARDLLRTLNPNVTILLTVSPVPLTASASADHVLVATIHSKSILRAAAGTMAERFEDVFYFPSYELIASHIGGAYYEPNKRTVSAEGIDHAMRLFEATYVADRAAAATPPARGAEREEHGSDIICDDEGLEESFGF